MSSPPICSSPKSGLIKGLCNCLSAKLLCVSDQPAAGGAGGGLGQKGKQAGKRLLVLLPWRVLIR